MTQGAFYLDFHEPSPVPNEYVNLLCGHRALLFGPIDDDTEFFCGKCHDYSVIDPFQAEFRGAA
jgi:hypothetical protein